MKYYIGKIMERNGDFEYSDTYLFATKGDPHKVAKKIAKNWRGTGEWDASHDGWWNDHTLIFNEGFREIPEEDYIILNKYIPAIPN